MLILLIEDETQLAELVIEYLELEGHECDYAQNGRQALTLIHEQKFDLIILDLNLPDIDGLAVCQQMRAQGINTPCIMLTARDRLADKIEGFNKGADDYLVKPFAMDELVVRIHALTRRGQHLKCFQIHDLFIYPDERQAKRGNSPLKLSPDEWRLLLLLARNSPNVVSRLEIEQHIWPNDSASDDAIKMLIYRLRKIVDQQTPALLHTIRGAGVCLRLES